MDANQASENSARDQLWASLRALRPEIDRLAAGEHDSSEHQKKMIVLLARIVSSELDFRLRDTAPE
jgi:hypothetical protein